MPKIKAEEPKFTIRWGEFYPFAPVKSKPIIIDGRGITKPTEINEPSTTSR